MVTLLIMSMQQIDCIYRNQIIQVRKIDGKKTYTVIITFENPAPILTYAPESFEESLDGSVYRCFMPNTTIAESLEQTMPVMMQQLESGVRYFLQGKLLKKVVGERTVLIQMGA